MNRMLPAIVAGIAVAVLGIAVLGPFDGRWGYDHTEAGTVATTEDGETIVVFDDDRRGFFPAGLLLFPFFWIAVFGLGFLLLRRTGLVTSGLPNRRPNRWLNEWHRAAHEDE